MATEQMTTHLQTIVLEPAPEQGVPASPSFVTQASGRASRSSSDVSRDRSSASFDSAAYPSAGARPRPGAAARMDPGQPQWAHRVSASFSALADQIAAAGKAIALMPQPPMPGAGAGNASTPTPDSARPSDVTTAVANGLMEQLQEVQETQRRLEEGLTELREKVDALAAGPEEVKKQLEDLAAQFKLDQQRLPARLHNALCTMSKNPIKPVVAANGKPPGQFPATRGELEHLTKERYEGMMKAYGIPIAGDLAAKRAAVRSFVGIPE